MLFNPAHLAFIVSSAAYGKLAVFICLCNVFLHGFVSPSAVFGFNAVCVGVCVVIVANIAIRFWFTAPNQQNTKKSDNNNLHINGFTTNIYLNG